MNFLDTKTIEKLDRRLLKVIQEEYPDCDGTRFAEIEKVEIHYESGDPFVNMIIHFGRFNTENKEHDFDQRVEIIYKSGNLEFIAGQFFQKIMDEDL